MRKNIILVSLLVILAATIYFIQFLIFRKQEDTFFYLLQDLAFVPIQVLIVTLIFNKILNVMEAQKKIKRINVIISSFFIEVGTPIIKEMTKLNLNIHELYRLIEIKELTETRESLLIKRIREFDFQIQVDSTNLKNLKGMMNGNRTYLLNMLSNDNLLEHDSFTDMLWAVFHVGDELKSCHDIDKLTKDETLHIANDVHRAYSALIYQWIHYMRYLHREYPFLYASEIKKIPFIENCHSDKLQ